MAAKRRSWPIAAVAGLFLLGWLPAAFAQDAGDAESELAARKRFETHIRPVLATRCLKCHGPEKQRGGLRLDSRAAVLAGGESGPAIVPGEPENSLLVEAVRHESLEMPPDGKLPEDDIAHLAAWIRGGAFWPEELNLAAAQRTLTDEDRDWWAYRPVADPPVPAVEHAGWARNDIDRFILARLREQSLSPSPPARREVLIRRLYFDLLGLPPSPEAVQEFLADESPDAYERLVDRLLESPHYGERWARHWLDLVRFAESDGYKQDDFRPEAWRYRDYVIRAFNEDKPYDRFVTEQLAGDELAPEDPEALVATMYLRHGQYEYNQRDVAGQWAMILNEVTDVTADVFLASGVSCARCHDHKFDPILQRDYYRLRAFFAPLWWREDVPVASAAQQAEYRRQLARWEAMTADLRAELDAIERPVLLRTAGGQGFDKFSPELRAMISKPPAQREPLEHQLAELACRQLEFKPEKIGDHLQGEDKARWESLRARLAEFDSQRPQPLPSRRFGVTDVGRVAPPTYIEGKSSLGPIEPGFLSVLDPQPARLVPPPPGLETTGRRLTLARWIADPANPLSTRAIVNRVWSYHFGRGLVATTSDFGRLGEPPSHPELLDWLTSRFLEQGWRLKPLHRLIVTSAAYRQTALRDDPLAQRVDPQNRLLWRQSTRRLEAEAIRDAMLAVTGELDRTTYGPSVAGEAPRRSIYVKVLRNRREELLAAFDAPDGLTSVSERLTTTSPTQALLLINGPWSLKRAAQLAQRVRKEASPDAAAHVERLWWLAYGRAPHSDERQEALRHLEAAEDAAVALEDLCHVLLNSNEFLYID